MEPWVRVRYVCTIGEGFQQAARAMAMATERVNVTDGEGNSNGGKIGGDGNKESNGKGAKSDGYGNKEGNGNSSKIDGNSNKEGNGKGGQWRGREGVWQW